MFGMNLRGSAAPNFLLSACLLASMTACGGGESENSPAPSSSGFVKFSGSDNGEAVVDAYNNYAKFLTTTRSMDVLGLTSDITLDSNNNLVKSGNLNIGKVQLVAGNNGTTIAGMVATDGTMLAIQKTGSSVTLDKSSVRFAPPGSSSGTGTGTGTGTGSLQACSQLNYPGDSSDPQVYSFDKIAQFDACAYRATGDSRYIQDGNLQCKVLDGFLNSTNSTFKPLFCNGPLLKY